MPKFPKGNPGGPGRPRGSRNYLNAAVAAGVSDGRLSPQDGAALSSMLETHRRAFELVAQQSKIEELEGRVAHYKAKLA